MLFRSDLEIDDAGLARRGLLIRHLVLPHGLAGTQGVVSFLAREVSPDTYLNILAQYHPCYQAFSLPQLARPLDEAEFAEAVSLARRQGLNRLDEDAIRLPRLTPR